VNVSAVIVTRGDVDLSPVLDSLPREWQKVIWDNSQRARDLSVFGRYAAISECEHETIYVQDDDCLLAPESLVELAAAAEEMPRTLVANQPAAFRHDFYTDHCLVGFGAMFNRDLPMMAFGRFFLHGAEGLMPSEALLRAITEQPQPFLRTADIIFTTLAPRFLVDVPYTDREFASAPNRMWKQPDHLGERTRMLELARKVRDA
jgi:hypothetical protein